MFGVPDVLGMFVWLAVGTLAMIVGGVAGWLISRAVRDFELHLSWTLVLGAVFLLFGFWVFDSMFLRMGGTVASLTALLLVIKANGLRAGGFSPRDALEELWGKVGASILAAGFWMGVTFGGTIDLFIAMGISVGLAAAVVKVWWNDGICERIHRFTDPENFKIDGVSPLDIFESPLARGIGSGLAIVVVIAVGAIGPGSAFAGEVALVAMMAVLAGIWWNDRVRDFLHVYTDPSPDADPTADTDPEVDPDEADLDPEDVGSED